MRSIRGIMAALAVLALTGGAALAAGPFPDAAHNGLDRAPGLAIAEQASGKTVPPGLLADLAMPADLEEPEVDEETEEAENHGATVSEAARGDTPEGWKNHGAYVSAVARGLVEVGDEAPEAAVDNGGRMPKPDKPGKPPKTEP
jgi:hypothetical protein